jgi:LmbE family N-acetylglucosaminyl deacetylase
MSLSSNEFTPASAMVIVAHPDDIEFGAAGTVAKWAARGCSVVYVVTTSGNGGTHDAAYTRETIGALREQEQSAAALLCGVKTVEYLRENDGEVMPTLALRKKYVEMIRKHKPEVVIAMDPTMMFSGNEYINHPDHRAVAVATMDAIAPVAGMPLMYPELGPAHEVREVWILFTDHADVWIDISATLETKINALLEHKSQVGPDVAPMVRKWAMDAGRGMVAAEGFRVMMLKPRIIPNAAAA